MSQVRKTDDIGATLPRLGWLDALRGVAVLLVVYEHLTWHVLGVLRAYTQTWFDAGRAGVFLFFIISGYIVPASLERRGSLRRFWVSRIFRLYPLVVVGAIAALVLSTTGLARLDPVAIKKTWATAIASATMLQDPLSLPSTPAVLWSLSYEMIFYLLLSALFAFGVHRLSAQWAIVFACVAVGLGGLLPVTTLSAMGVGALGAAIMVTLAAVPGVAGLMSGRRTAILAGALAVGGLAVGLLATSQRFPGWYTTSILAAMFAGTTLYRAERGQLSWRTAAPVVCLVFAAITAAIWWVLPDLGWATLRTTGHWVGSITLAATIFAVGMRLRGRRFPPALVKLGLISYSVYVLHYLLVVGLDGFLDRHHDDRLIIQALLAAGFVALVVGVSALSYRFVERPMQDVGRRVGRLLDRHLGPDAPRPHGGFDRLIVRPQRQNSAPVVPQESTLR